MIASPVTLEAFRSIDFSFYSTSRSVVLGRLLLVYLANNGRLTESSKELNLGHQRLRKVLVSTGCVVTRKRGKDQGAIAQPEKIHELAKTWADFCSDRDIVPALLERYAEAMRIGQERRGAVLANKANRRANELYSAAGEQPTRFLERKQDPPWWSHIDEHN